MAPDLQSGSFTFGYPAGKFSARPKGGRVCSLHQEAHTCRPFPWRLAQLQLNGIGTHPEPAYWHRQSATAESGIGVSVVAAEAETVVITPGAVEPKPVIITVSVTIQPDGSALVDGQGAPGKTYRILAANDVTGPYAEIGTATADTTGAFSFIDTDAPNHPTRFYRAVWP